ncbi:hypothetical protein ES705_33831 [subsurface metagenome]
MSLFFFGALLKSDKSDKKGTKKEMAFLRKKGPCFYLVACSRISGKPRQKVLAYFGRCPTRSKFEEAKTRVEKRYPDLKIDWTRVAEKLKADRSPTGRILWDYAV